jgi:hypothetical protein
MDHHLDVDVGWRLPGLSSVSVSGEHKMQTEPLKSNNKLLYQQVSLSSEFQRERSGDLGKHYFIKNLVYTDTSQ